MQIRFKLPALMLVTVVACAACSSGPAPTPDDPPKPRNLIFFLGDGMGAPQIKAYRLYADDPATPGIDPLPFDPLLVGAVATESIARVCDDTLACVDDPYHITDSAASATAYATGADTLIQTVGQDAEGQPLTSILAIAKGQGMATGVVSTSQVTHASPASFVAHVPSRSQYHDIADQFLDNRVGDEPLADVILGGGVDDFRREDRDLITEFGGLGFGYVEDREALLAASGPKLLGLFAPIALPRHWDRPADSPSLADMTRKALEVLSADEDGFVLIVEGSQIDWAGHGNDIVGVVSEMEGFREAIEVGLAFAEADGETLLAITADHETGGLSLGAESEYRWDPRPLRGLEATPAALVEAFLSGSEPLAAFVAARVPFELTEDERRSLDGAARDPREVYMAINQLFAARTFTGWTTLGHTGVDVPLYATGPGSEAFRGVMQNEAVGQSLIDAVERQP